MPHESTPRVNCLAMRTAHTTLWERLFELANQPGLSLQARLRTAVVHAILDGRLVPGTAMPSSRHLSTLLGVSRNTVTAAYQQLVDEAFLEAQPRSGFFVAAQARQAVADPTEKAAQPAFMPAFAPDWAVRVVRSLRASPTLSKPAQWRAAPYPFIYGTHDPALFPTEHFRECCVRSLARSQQPYWAPDFETDDVPDLIEQIRLRLLPKRGVFALGDEILVTVGAQQALHLLAEALFDRRTRVGFEEPGYPHARHSFKLRNPRMIAVPVDEEGASVDALPALDYLFVTPSQQSPTTSTMGLARRQRLLKRAEQQDFIVIEDDYEADNLYDGKPMPALKSLDKSGRVIYVGSLSKSLSPAVRLGYIVAPRALIEELRGLRHAMVRHPSAFLQHAYAQFLSLGHHESHARRVSQAMRERVALTAAALRTHLADFSFRLPQGGASLWVRGPAWLDAGELAITAQRHGVLIEPGAVFFAAPVYPCPFFRLRLSSIPSDKIVAGVQALAHAVRELGVARGHL